jgi:hypothetical protein
VASPRGYRDLLSMNELPNNVTEAFLVGLHGAEFTSVTKDSLIVHIVTKEPGPILLLFQKLSRWPASELIDDRETAYRVGRAFRISSHYLDELAVPVETGKQILEDLIRLGNLHIKINDGRLRFGPGHIIDPVLNALGSSGAYPQFLKKANVSRDRLSEAMWAYVRANFKEFEPFSRN